MALGPKESGQLIAELAEHVKIKREGIEKLGKQFLLELESNSLSPQNFSQHEIHPKPFDPWAVDWIFLVDTLNFCFWKLENHTGWTVEGYTGYFALCAAIKRAQKDGVDIVNPRFYSTITEEKLAHILRSDNEHKVPLLEKRVKCLHEVGTVLLEKYNGTFKSCIMTCDNSAVKLLNLIITEFPCFRDTAIYKGHKVALYKRAQILIGDLWACYNNKDFGRFTDIEKISMFADYRVPQSLIYFGAMEYSEDLKDILEANILLENGSEMEVEIRGCSIYAVELLKEWVTEHSPDKKFEVNSVLIDHFLWDFRRKHADEILKMKIPFHKTLSIYY